MAYRIDPGEPVGAEVRRALGEQLRRAADDLARPPAPSAPPVPPSAPPPRSTPDGSGADTVVEATGTGAHQDVTGAARTGPSEDSVHTARKRIKKARSLLRLARPDLGSTVVRHAQAELRECADRLAPQREADAAVEAAIRLELAAHRERLARGLAGEADEAVSETAAGAWWLVEFLRTDAERRQARGALTWPAARSVALRLVRTAEWIDRVPARVDGWDAIGPGLHRQYRLGRAALGALPDEPTVEELHEWRKRVKDLGYQTRLLRNLWPDVLKPVQRAAEELADLLGADHDLGLLLARLSAERDVDRQPGEREPEHREFLLRLDARLSSRPGDPEPHQWSDDGLDDTYEPLDALQTDHRRYLRELITAERATMQGDARRLGARLYAERPRARTRRLRTWWLLAEATAKADREAAIDLEAAHAARPPG
ncbi:MAG: domain containing protein [Acidimicrobiales bacterium]|nr:domain containing protein [Acidimicrobiales bacterium]